MRHLLLSLALLLFAAPAWAKDEACSYGSTCFCDCVQDSGGADGTFKNATCQTNGAARDSHVVFCEDFEDPSLNDGDTAVFSTSCAGVTDPGCQWGEGWKNKYGAAGDSCTNQSLPNGFGMRVRGEEGTHPFSCYNIVQEGVCDVSTQTDCAFQGTSSLGNRYVPGIDSAGGGGKGFASGTNFNVTMAVKFSKNYVRADPGTGSFYPRKTDEWGDGGNCLLGCSSSSYSQAPSESAAPYHQALWWNGSTLPTLTEVVGHANISNSFGWYPDVDENPATPVSGARWNFDRDHGLDSWHCWRVSIDNVRQQNGRIRSWMDDRLLVDLQNIDLRNMKDAAIDNILWDHYYNTPQADGVYRGPTVAYRYEDNIVVTTSADPVSCAAIGFGASTTNITGPMTATSTTHTMSATGSVTSPPITTGTLAATSAAHTMSATGSVTSLAAVQDVTVGGFTQAAINTALGICADGFHNGCRLIFPAGTYSGVMVSIGAMGTNQNGFELLFQPGAILTAPVPIPSPGDVIQIKNGAPNGFWIHGPGVIDGRKSQQPFSVMDTDHLTPDCISAHNLSGLAGPTSGLIEDVECKEHLKNGISAYQGTNIEVRNVYVHDNGCELNTSCAGLGGLCKWQVSGANGYLSSDPHCIDAHGIQSNGVLGSGLWAHGNRVERVTKQGLGTLGGVGNRPDNVRYEYNLVDSAGYSGIENNGGTNFHANYNTIIDSGSATAIAPNGVGIGETGVNGNIEVVGNVITGSKASGITIVDGGVATISNNVVDSSCQNAAGTAAIVLSKTSPLSGVGVYHASGNTIRSSSGPGCRFGMFVQNVGTGSTIDGDHYEIGDQTDSVARGLQFEAMTGQAVTVTNTYIEGGAGNAVEVKLDVIGSPTLTVGASNTTYAPNGDADGCNVQSPSTAICTPVKVSTQPTDTTGTLAASATTHTMAATGSVTSFDITGTMAAISTTHTMAATGTVASPPATTGTMAATATAHTMAAVGTLTIPPGLPDVLIGGALNQAAIDTALNACKATAGGGGCRMIAPVGTVTGTLNLGTSLANGFELVCAGIGLTTWKMPIGSTSTFIVQVGQGTPNDGSIHGCTFDGQSQLQPESVLAGGVKAAAIAVSNQAAGAGPTGWRIYDNETRNTLGHGVFVRQGTNIEVDHNFVHDSGCSAEVPCPVIDGGFGYDAGPSGYCAIKAGTSGQQTNNCVDGIGIEVGGPAVGANVHDNEVWNVAKACVVAYNNGSSPPFVGVPPSDFTFADNYVHECGFNGFSSNGGVQGSIVRNVAAHMGGKKSLGTANGNCYQATGFSYDLTFDHNVCVDAQTSGMQLVSGNAIVATNNVLERLCMGNPSAGAISLGTALPVTGTPGTYMISGNTVRRGISMGCRYALFAQNIGPGSSITVNYLEGSRRTSDSAVASAVRFELLTGAGATVTGNWIDAGLSHNAFSVKYNVAVTDLHFDGTNTVFAPNAQTACDREVGSSGATVQCGPPTVVGDQLHVTKGMWIRR